MTRRYPIGAILLSVVSLAAFSGCRTSGYKADKDKKQALKRDEVTLLVKRERGLSDVPIRATVTHADGNDRVPFLLIPPGGGNVSRRGLRVTDGIIVYGAPIATTEMVANEAAVRGYVSIAWDKRTCTPEADEACPGYPQEDIDAEGPIAMLADYEAACRLAAEHPRFDGRLIWWAHGQATQLAIEAQCDGVAAKVLAAPIPRGIDKVLANTSWAWAKIADREAKTAAREGAPDSDRLHAIARERRNQAGSREAFFEALHAGQFEKDARVLGATVAFWKAWVDLTARIPGENPSPRVPWIVVLGDRDTQYGDSDRQRIKKLGSLPGAKLVTVDADHHLTKSGWEDPPRLAPIFEALETVLAQGGKS